MPEELLVNPVEGEEGGTGGGGGGGGGEEERIYLWRGRQGRVRSLGERAPRFLSKQSRTRVNTWGEGERREERGRRTPGGDEEEMRRR